MITLTDKAQQKIKEISDDESIGHYCIRIKLIGGGCASFERDMYYDNQPTDMDEVFEIGDVKVIIDTLSLQYLEGTEIDYLEGLIESGFRFNTPGVKVSCGCGSSIGF